MAPCCVAAHPATKMLPCAIATPVARSKNEAGIPAGGSNGVDHDGESVGVKLRTQPSCIGSPQHPLSMPTTTTSRELTAMSNGVSASEHERQPGVT